MKPFHIDAALLGGFGLLAFVAVLYSAAGGEPRSVELLSSVFLLVALMLGWFHIRRGRPNGRSIHQALATVALPVMILASVAITHWPLRLSYAWSCAAFDDIARRVRAGERIEAQRVGPFRILRAEVYFNGLVCLWTDLDPGGKTGFVQCPPDNPPRNLWGIVRLDDRWQFISED
jgi:hypothetical protein